VGRFPWTAAGALAGHVLDQGSSADEGVRPTGVLAANMNAEIIAVGSELLTPQRVDTNSLYLTDQLNDLGVEVVTKSVIGDDLNRLTDAVRRAVSRSDIVVLSGGLGPTEDDLTRDAVGAALDRRLVYHPEITEVLEQRFAQLKRKMVESNKRQAFIIEGAEILANDRGTAPGQWIEESGACLMLLPGPPHELKAMFTRQCLPRLARIVPRQVIRTLVLRVTGMPESDLDQLQLELRIGVTQGRAIDHGRVTDSA